MVVNRLLHPRWWGNDIGRDACPCFSPPKKGAGGMILLRLRQLGDDCEERARRSHNADARSLYHLAARDARIAASGRGMGEDALRATLIHIEELAAVARRYDGEGITSTDLLSAGSVPIQPDLWPLQFDESGSANIYLTGAPETPSHACPRMRGIADRLYGAHSLVMDADRASWRSSGQVERFNRGAYPDLPPLWRDQDPNPDNEVIP